MALIVQVLFLLKNTTMKLIKRIDIKDLSKRDLKFIEVASWSASCCNLNGSGLSFSEQKLETSNDVMLFVIEKSEDNRYMREGSISEFGTIYGLSAKIVQIKMEEENASNPYFTKYGFNKP